MTSKGPFAARPGSWLQLLVIALVIVLSDLAGTWWLRTQSNSGPSSATAGAASGTGGSPAEALLDDEMSKAVRRAALEGGINPTTLPELSALWTQLAMRGLTSDVDTSDRAAVQPARAHPATRPPPAPRRARDDGAPGQDAAPDAPGASAALAPSVERLDERQALRLTELATSKGLEASALLPSAQLRQAAISSGDANSEASQALMEAYTLVMQSLEAMPDAE